MIAEVFLSVALMLAPTTAPTTAPATNQSKLIVELRNQIEELRAEIRDLNRKLVAVTQSLAAREDELKAIREDKTQPTKVSIAAAKAAVSSIPHVAFYNDVVKALGKPMSENRSGDYDVYRWDFREGDRVYTVEITSRRDGGMVEDISTYGG